MLLQSNMTIVICTSFYYNQNYIEKYLCIQRDMKNNNCHGQCYLMKKIKEKQENEQKNFKVHFHEATIVTAYSTDLAPVKPITISKTTYPIYQVDLRNDKYINAIFRPPILA